RHRHQLHPYHGHRAVDHLLLAGPGRERLRERGSLTDLVVHHGRLRAAGDQDRAGPVWERDHVDPGG
ncbi:MAG: hypothetical protein KDC03_21675, partial [Flavobacteriales bacterium]|nr:hypothetical protein [Flavobacteriales bacterium]